MMKLFDLIKKLMINLTTLKLNNEIDILITINKICIIVMLEVFTVIFIKNNLYFFIGALIIFCLFGYCIKREKDLKEKQED